MKIAIGSDHAGFLCKQEIKAYLIEKGNEVVDYGTDSENSCDYPDIALPLATDVAKGKYDKGVLICSTGIGIGISANKVNGIRCALCTSPIMAEFSRRHNNANIIAMGARNSTIEEMKNYVDIFISTEFEGGRHLRRVDKMTKIEQLQK